MNLNIIQSLKVPCYAKTSSPRRLLKDGATCLWRKKLTAMYSKFYSLELQ